MIEVKPTDVAAITPYWRNPRDNTKAVEPVKKSIAEFGFNSPIILDDKLVIIAGHTRYRAAVELGMTVVPAVIVKLSAQDAKAYRIADNKTGELATWNMADLIPELREIANIDSMQDFFLDLDLPKVLEEKGGQGVKLPTQSDVRKVQQAAETRFEEASKDTEDNMVELFCPCCADSFFVSRTEIQRLLAKGY